MKNSYVLLVNSGQNLGSYIPIKRSDSTIIYFAGQIPDEAYTWYILRNDSKSISDTVQYFTQIVTARALNTAYNHAVRLDTNIENQRIMIEFPHIYEQYAIAICVQEKNISTYFTYDGITYIRNTLTPQKEKFEIIDRIGLAAETGSKCTKFKSLLLVEDGSSDESTITENLLALHNKYFTSA